MDFSVVCVAVHVFGRGRYDTPETRRFRPSERQSKLNHNQVSYSVANRVGLARVYPHVPEGV